MGAVLGGKLSGPRPHHLLHGDLHGPRRQGGGIGDEHRPEVGCSLS